MPTPCRSPRLLPAKWATGGEAAPSSRPRFGRAVSDLTHIDLGDRDEPVDRDDTLRGVFAFPRRTMSAHGFTSDTEEEEAKEEPTALRTPTSRDQDSDQESDSFHTPIHTPRTQTISDPPQEPQPAALASRLESLDLGRRLQPPNLPGKKAPLPPEVNERAICRHFLNGKCSKGHRCRFRHADPSGAAEVPTPPPQTSKKALHRLPTFGPGKLKTEPNPEPPQQQMPHYAPHYAAYHAPLHYHHPPPAASAYVWGNPGFGGEYHHPHEGGWTSYGGQLQLPHMHTGQNMSTASHPASVSSPQQPSTPVFVTSPASVFVASPAVSPRVSAVRSGLGSEPDLRDSLKSSLEKMRGDANEQAQFHAEQARAIEVLLKGFANAKGE